MLIVLSPAKTLDFETEAPSCESTEPRWIDDSQELIGLLKQQTPVDLQNLMGISESLAELNHGRYQDWHAPHPRNGSKQAMFAFQGDVYQGLQAETFTAKQIQRAQGQLRILSGLYGVLRPLDRILPYRLEMGTKLANSRGKDLYAFWGDRITEQIADAMHADRSRLLLNLASNEYFRSLDASSLPAPVVAPAFKEFKNGSYKMISFFAKKARGSMAAWVIRHRARTMAKLTQFAEDGYRYDAESSTERVPVFLRGPG
ncbi:peroxide stress protein YaaA [Allorhodopirellula solitaria]|uniref:UPF0246 protein CA85_13740 n=1 Tax=Allorhodopirellula solitaria TaxID=2527987 RepID=A0A5C5YDN5_9BACT|nr:peroxide stress protein YaaA [Allorhodopirellula solitaria]TWT72913.1 hypothetical protein CA85_13740 [Allorhodopirellula solitaria]